MDRIGRVDWKPVVLWALAGAAWGCSGGSTGSPGAATLAPGEKLHCEAPACCVPVDIDPSTITVYRRENDIGIDVILDLPATSADAWNANVEASLSWGPRVTCTTTISSYPQTFVAVTCPAVPLDGAPACDSAATLTLRPSTSTYSDTAGTQVLCAGRPGNRVELPATLTCPSCPSLSESSIFQPCDFPDATCDYPALTSSGNTADLPCTCAVNGVYGDRRWSCAVP